MYKLELHGKRPNKQSEFNSFKNISDVIKNIEIKLSTHPITLGK